MPTILKGIIRFAFRGALIWAILGLMAVPIIGGFLRQDSHASTALINQITDKTWFWNSVILFAIAGATDGITYCCCLAFFWTGGVRVPTELDMFFGRSMTLAEARSRTPFLIYSAAIGALLGLIFLPPEGGPDWSRAGMGGIIGLVGGACVFALSARIVDGYSRYLR